MKLSNPIFKEAEASLELVSKEKIELREVRLLSLSLSFITFLIFTGLYFLNKFITINNVILIAVTTLSFILMVSLFILEYKGEAKKIFISIVLSICIGIFLSFLFSFLYKYTSTITSKNIEVANHDSIIFIFIGFSLIFTPLVSTIYYLFDNLKYNSFWFKYLAVSLIDFLLSILFILFMRNGQNFSLFLSLVTVLVLIFLENFIITLYEERVRILVQNEVGKEWLLPLSITINTSPIYFLIETIKLAITPSSK